MVPLKVMVMEALLFLTIQQVAGAAVLIRLLLIQAVQAAVVVLQQVIMLVAQVITAVTVP